MSEFLEPPDSVDEVIAPSVYRFTITVDYYASGEGRRLVIMMLYARDKADALEKFTKKYGDFLAEGAEVHEGYLFDHVVSEFFISADVMAELEQSGFCEFNAEYYVNRS